MAKATTTQRGFKLRCPMCGEEDTLRLDLDDVSKLFCSQCDSDFTTGDVKEIVRQWQKCLLWLETAPILGADD
jgi:uncharacterized protein (DUF983 family)